MVGLCAKAYSHDVTSGGLWYSVCNTSNIGKGGLSKGFVQAKSNIGTVCIHTAHC